MTNFEKRYSSGQIDVTKCGIIVMQNIEKKSPKMHENELFLIYGKIWMQLSIIK